ncbi:zinc metalloprotease [Nitrosospira sp. NpAV]|nr:zinc metalloprotease [Nitrosospira sp. NpAV]
MRRVSLNGKEVAYTLKRCKRRTIGMKIDSRGLTVRAPSRESLHWIESVLQNKADWVVEKLDEWKTRESSEPVWEEGAIFPLLGEPWQLSTTTTGIAQMTRAKVRTGVEDRQMQLPLPSVLTSRQIEKIVMDWYHHNALTCFSERIALYADKLGVALPQLRLSRARTQWGSCNARGVIHLNWRLIQMPLKLVDYVVAHELSHLIEMNHSSAFWQTVGRIYPDYGAARKELKRLG